MVAEIIHGDCLEEMRKMADNSISAIVTDPPYMINFMGKAFDKFKDNPASNPDVWKECLRICKPGSYLLAFGGDRTHHHLMIALENAGWEIRTCLYWIFGSGFPKSHNFGKKMGDEWSGYGTALKPAAEIIIMAMKPLDGTFAQNAEKWGQAGINIADCRINTLTCQRLLDKISDNEVLWEQEKYLCNSCVNHVENKTKLKTLEIAESFATRSADQILIGNARQFLIDLNILDIGCSDIRCQEEQRKKSNENISLNTSKYGKELTELSPKDLLSIILTMIHTTIELKICSLCRKEITHDITSQNMLVLKKETLNMLKERVKKEKGSRWPSNIIFDEESGRLLDEMSGQSKSSSSNVSSPTALGQNSGWNAHKNRPVITPGHNDFGGASRFFYCAKASSRERNEGLEGFSAVDSGHEYGFGPSEGRSVARGETPKANNHPTVKPLKLMEYLIRLVMPPKDGTLLDPFAGSGTTILAAKRLGFNAIGIEKQKEYCDIANARINSDYELF